MRCGWCVRAAGYGVLEGVLPTWGDGLRSCKTLLFNNRRKVALLTAGLRKNIDGFYRVLSESGLLNDCIEGLCRDCKRTVSLETSECWCSGFGAGEIECCNSVV